MKLLICGYGFVGKAHALALEGVDVTTHVYDPAKGFDAMISDPDAAIIAVATPMGNDGSCDMSAIYECLEKIPEDITLDHIESTVVIYEVEDPDQTIIWFNRGTDMVETFDIGGMIENLAHRAL